MPGRSKEAVVVITQLSELGPALRQVRRNSGRVQGVVAQQSGRSLKFVSDLENGKTSPPFEAVLDVIKAMGGRMELVFPAPGQEDS